MSPDWRCSVLPGYAISSGMRSVAAPCGHPPHRIIDYRSVAAAMAEDIRDAQGEIRLGVEVTGISRRGEHLALTAGEDPVVTRHVIACAGLHADRLARMTGSEAEEQIVPFRGDYYTLTASAAQMIHGLIYPVPDPRFPFLGIHLTRTSDGRVLAGPNAVLALHREGYRRRDFRPRGHMVGGNR